MKAIKIILPVRTVRRLIAAEGYLQLGMPDYALLELGSIEDAKPVEASVEFLTGEAFRQQERYDDAVKSLERAAELIPEPYNKIVWLSLSDCFRQRGEEELADIAATFAAEAAAVAEPDFDPNEVEADDFDPGGFAADEPESYDDNRDDIAGPWHDRWS